MAEAIPPEKYDWRPDAKARTVSEVFVHIATGNFMLLDVIGVGAPIDLYAHDRVLEVQWHHTPVAGLETRSTLAKLSRDSPSREIIRGREGVKDFSLPMGSPLSISMDPRSPTASRTAAIAALGDVSRYSNGYDSGHVPGFPHHISSHLFTFQVAKLPPKSGYYAFHFAAVSVAKYIGTDQDPRLDSVPAKGLFTDPKLEATSGP